ncbi:MAG: hypothetical protein J2P16_04825 [Mycobacterium sp.]|nr:hypothetical protein [Mycobacterium sp.]
MNAPPPTRTRWFRSVAVAASIALAVGMVSAIQSGTASASTTEPDRAQLYAPFTYRNSGGDVWSSTWADDGNLYSISDDTGGWNSACNSNFAVNMESGDDPLHLVGHTVNCMSDYGFAGFSQPNGYNWKAESIISIDGTLYASIGNMIYDCCGHRQFIENSTLIKSTDHGKTWTPSETQNYDRPMFPYRGFAPFFIQYGQDDNPASTADGADQYVYAISNDGYYNNGDETILGRVPRDKIGRLDGADWQFYRGGPGLQDSSWGSIDQAKSLLDVPFHIGSAQVQYDAPLHKYLYIPWYWAYTIDSSGVYRPNYAESTWNAYEAPTPWGPWQRFKSHQFTADAPDVGTYGQGWYGPIVAPKFISPDGRQLYVFAANLVDRYALNVFPMVINGGTAPPSGTLNVPNKVVPGDTFQATVDVHNLDTTMQVHNPRISLTGPDGWTTTARAPTQTATIEPGGDFTVPFDVTVPTDEQANTSRALTGTLSYDLDGNTMTVPIEAQPISVLSPIQIVSFTANPATIHPGDSTTFQAVLRNRGHVPLSGALTINGPADWTVTPASQAYSLDTGQQESVTATTTDAETTGQTVTFTADATYANGTQGDSATAAVFTGHLRCLLGHTPDEIAYADPGYGCTLDQGYEFYDPNHTIWPVTAPASYCWCQPPPGSPPSPLLFHVSVPAGVSGTLRLFIVDGDNFQGGRVETIKVEGREVGTFSNFQQGEWVQAPVTAADTADGRINVEVDNARAGSNVVVSEVNF